MAKVQRLSECEDTAKIFGWIDSMSITQVVQAFEVWPKSNSPYRWYVPTDVTAFLICTDNIILAGKLGG
jgi:hypothetical protein